LVFPITQTKHKKNFFDRLSGRPDGSLSLSLSVCKTPKVSKSRRKNTKMKCEPLCDDDDDDDDDEEEEEEEEEV
jgi:hypothetical protein